MRKFQLKKVFSFTFTFIVILLLLSCNNGNKEVQEHTGKDTLNQPNIIFVFADDWGYGDLGIHGSTFCKTPNLDQMASEGIDFQNFSVVSPVCSPSRVGVMTGQFPARQSVHGHFATVESHIKRNMPDWLDPNVPMLPRMLKKAGYATAHFGKWHLSNWYVEDAPSPIEYGYDEYAAFNLPKRLHQMQADSTIYKTIDFVKRHKDDQPFFVNAWIHATHTPHYPKDKYMKQFANLDEQHQVYAALVAEYDARIGELFAALKKLGLDKNTLVIFSSDNGPAPIKVTGKDKIIEDTSTGPGLGSYYSVSETGDSKGVSSPYLQGAFASRLSFAGLVKYPPERWIKRRHWQP